jgi:hypothetical protein
MKRRKKTVAAALNITATASLLKERESTKLLRLLFNFNATVTHQNPLTKYRYKIKNLISQPKGNDIFIKLRNLRIVRYTKYTVTCA